MAVKTTKETYLTNKTSDICSFSELYNIKNSTSYFNTLYKSQSIEDYTTLESIVNTAFKNIYNATIQLYCDNIEMLMQHKGELIKTE